VDIIDDYPLHDMSLDEARKIFSPDFLKQLKHLNINGNLGDFVTARDGVEIVRYFREANPKLLIEISTNAGARPAIWEELAHLGAKVYFCLDGLKDSHELYRQQTNWDTVISNAKKFISAGGVAIWKMIRFEHNAHQIDECRQLSKEIGFYRFDIVDHGRNEFPVFDQQQNYLHDIGNHTQPKDFKVVFARYQDARTNGWRPELEHKKIRCWAKKNKSIYVTATGDIYPCCWLGFYPRTMWHLGNNDIKQILPATNNALEIGLESAVDWFNQIEKSWDGAQLLRCNTVCGN
jgi:MoaA/NifB/PqqE/SkfB family radical SAM enzyme